MSKKTKKIYNLVFVVAHPDDESLWVGGVISHLSKLDFIKIYVVVLSGNDPKSPRVKEFEKASKVAGYAKGIILGGPLRKATEPLPALDETLDQGLKKLGLNIRQVDLLITHSSYGDEHRHPHHTQAFKELYKFSEIKKIPFGFFSSLPVPWYNLKPLTVNLAVVQGLQLVTFANCLENKKKLKSYRAPKFYLQFLSLDNSKQKMLDCYKSTNLKLMRTGYVSYYSNCESIYLYDERGIKLFRKLMNSMSVSGSRYLFSHLKNTIYNLKNTVKEKVGI